MKGRIFASPQMHQRAAGIGLFNELIRFGQVSDECDVAAAAEYRSVRDLRIACRADHDAGSLLQPESVRLLMRVARLPQFLAQFPAPGLRRMDTRKPLLRLHHLPRARRYYFRARHLLKIPSMSGRYQSKFRGSVLCPGPLLFLASRLALHHLAVKPCLVAFPSAVLLGFCWQARGLTRVQPPGIRIVSSIVSGNSLRAARQDKHS